MNQPEEENTTNNNIENIQDNYVTSSSEEEELKGLSRTDRDQKKTEDMIKKIFIQHKFDTKISDSFEDIMLYNKKLHYSFAQKQIYHLAEGYSSMENGMPWFSYWIFNR